MLATTILGILLAIVSVLAIVRTNRLKMEKVKLESELESRRKIDEASIAQLKRELQTQKELSDKTLATLKAEHSKAMEDMAKAHEKAEREMSLYHEKALAAMKESFKNLSNENSDLFKEKSASTIAELMKPVREKFDAFSKAVAESQQRSGEQHAALRENIENLMKQSKTVGDEAKNLAEALTGSSKVQGDFGEMLLTDILDNAGFQEGIHYVTQGVMTDEYGHEIKSSEGRTMIPDVMVRYPGEGVVIVDSKMSLTDYSRYTGATTPEEKNEYARRHVESIRKHVAELSGKDYNSYIPSGRKKVDYNIMFVPVEGAFSLMLRYAPRLWMEAEQKKVLIVSQMNLIVVLNMIKMSWTQHDQEENIARVYEVARDFMSKLRGWMESYVAIGEKLGAVNEAYTLSKNRLTGNGNIEKKGENLIAAIEKLENLGLQPKESKALPKGKSRIAEHHKTIIPGELLLHQDASDTH